MLGKTIQSIRLSKGLTQSQLATMTNCTDGLICQIEKGQTEPSLKRLRKIAKALGVSTSILLENEEEARN